MANSKIPLELNSDSKTLFNSGLSLEEATYSLNESPRHFLFICISTNWYGSEIQDNFYIFPSANWFSNEPLDIHRNNDETKPYARIMQRFNDPYSFRAKASNAGVYLRITGICRIS